MALITPAMQPENMETKKTLGQSILSHSPDICLPYLELMRLDRPAGFLALYTPCIIGTAYAAAISSTTPHPLPIPLILHHLLLWIPLCILGRGLGCTWNDIIDQDLDRQVTRCKTRPLARGALSTPHAFLFATLQLLTVLTLATWRFPSPSMPYAYAGITMLLIYPFAKRFTHYPQLILGLSFSVLFLWGARVLSLNPLSEPHRFPSFTLFTALTLWTVIYDTIYAHQDVADDVKAGVKSIAVRFRSSTKQLSSVLGVLFAIMLRVTGVAAGFGWCFFILSVLGSCLGLGAMVGCVDLAEPRSCARWFNRGFFLVGGFVLLGLLGEYGVVLFSDGYFE